MAPGIYRAAAALGIDVGVIDNPGHWLEGPEFAHWRVAFLPTRLIQPPDNEMADRILTSIRSYQRRVDGIITFCEFFQPVVARAAQQLGLHTEAPEALEIITDKYKMSIFEGKNALDFSNPLEGLQKVSSVGNSIYSAIIKPVHGWGSDCVFRVSNGEEFHNAMDRIKSLPPPIMVLGSL